MRKSLVAVALGLAVLLINGVAWAAFTPDFNVSLSTTKKLANPQLTFHLEFDADDEEIGNFKAFIPRGFDIAPDEAIPNDEEIGGGQVTIQAGPGCHPSSPTDAASAPVTISAVFKEKDRTDAEVDSGVHSVWFLDIEPANRVRLLVTGTKQTGWSIEGAPTPSDATCNPLVVDLNIYPKSASGVPIVTNPKRPRPKTLTADIYSQDSPAVAHFEQVIQITK